MRATCSKLKVAINKFQKAFSFIQDKEDIMICMMIVICWSEILSYLGKWAKLIQFDGENEYFCTGKVEKLQIYANVAMFVSLEKLWISCKVSCLFQKHTFDVDQKMSRIYAFRPPLSATVFLVWSIFWVFFRYRSRLIDIFGTRNDLFLGIFFLDNFFAELFLRIVPK